MIERMRTKEKKSRRKRKDNDMEFCSPKLLDSPKGCSFYERRGKLTSNSTLRNDLWDLEDLHQLAQKHKGPHFFLSPFMFSLLSVHFVHLLPLL
jgi:hypothetical protein